MYYFTDRIKVKKKQKQLYTAVGTLSKKRVKIKPYYLQVPDAMCWGNVAKTPFLWGGIVGNKTKDFKAKAHVDIVIIIIF